MAKTIALYALYAVVIVSAPIVVGAGWAPLEKLINAKIEAMYCAEVQECK